MKITERILNRVTIVAIILAITLLLFGCLPATVADLESAPQTQDNPQAPAESADLATAKVSAMITDPGRALITGHNDLEYYIDSEPQSQDLGEIGALLAAQVTCGVFVAEKTAKELDIPITGIKGTAAFDADNQRVQVFLDLPGADKEQVLDVANNFRQRCPVYTTLAEAESVDFMPGEQFKPDDNLTDVVKAELFQFGKANVTANDRTFFVDSVPVLDGPNNELNPLDMLLGSLASCSAFISEREAPTNDVKVVVEGDFNPSGVRNLDGPNPRIQNIRVFLQTENPDEVAAAEVYEQIKNECYLYSILDGRVDIQLSAEPLQS
jgi:uncharacterized OsmC-like protein